MTLTTSAYFQQPDWLLQIESVLETLNEGVVIVDDNLRIVFANEAVLRLSGHERGALLNRALDAVFAPEDLAYLMQQHTIAQQVGRHRHEYPSETGRPLRAGFWIASDALSTVIWKCENLARLPGDTASRLGEPRSGVALSRVQHKQI